MMHAGIAAATKRRRELVQGIHLLYALTQGGDGPAAELLARYGSSSTMLRPELERGM
jgi:hypothetical protein